MKQLNDKQKAAYAELLAESYRHLSTDLHATLASAAKVAHLSPFHFHRVFTQTFGMSPKAVTTEAQIEHAKRLLASTEIGAVEIADACGFSHQGHFCSRFKAMVGKSPGKYRRELKAAVHREAA